MQVSQVIDNNFQITRIIKSGAFGIVHLGFDIAKEKPVAIKEIHPFLFENKIYIDIFRDEVKKTVKLNHPNIVRVYDLRKTGENHFYIIMELIEGLDLRTILKNAKEMNSSVPKEVAVIIALNVCKALAYAHNKCDDKTGENLNMVHRDISPSNIMISKDGFIKTIDFGIAKARFSSIEESGLGFVKAKLPYMSPELAAGKDAIDNKTDIYSLGLVLFELLSNEKLFKNDDTNSLIRHVSDVQFDHGRIHQLEISEEIKKVIFTCFNKNPQHRFLNAGEIVPPLENFLKQIPAFEPPVALRSFICEYYTPDKSSKPVTALPKEKLETDESTKIIQTETIATNLQTDENEDLTIPLTETVIGHLGDKRNQENQESDKTILYDT